MHIPSRREHLSPQPQEELRASVSSWPAAGRFRQNMTDFTLNSPSNFSGPVMSRSLILFEIWGCILGAKSGLWFPCFMLDTDFDRNEILLLLF